VFRKYKHKLKFTDDKIVKQIMTYDQSSIKDTDEAGNVIVDYVDNPNKDPEGVKVGV